MSFLKVDVAAQLITIYYTFIPSTLKCIGNPTITKFFKSFY